MPFDNIRHGRKLAKSALKTGFRITRNASLLSQSRHPIWGPVPGVKVLSNPPIYPQAKQCSNAIEFSPAWTAVRNLPESLEGVHANEFLEERTHDLPPAAGACLKNGRILGSEGVVFDELGFLIAEPARKIGRGPQDWSELYSFKRPKPVFLEGTWGVLTGAGSKGYFHWMLDVLPKIEIIRSLSKKLDGWIIPKIQAPFITQSLNLAGISGPFYHIDDTGYVIAKQAIVASVPSESGNPPPWIKHFYESLAPKSCLAPRSKPIYVSRSQARRRRVVNESELIATLTRYGIDKVDMEDLSVAEQAALFQSAKTIIAPHGAGLTNLAFASPGTRVLELFSRDYVNVCYWALCCIADINYSYLTTSPASDGCDPCGKDIELTSAQISLIEEWSQRV
jgi:hypothetical protein